MLGDGDELRVFNATGQRLALPAVEGLPFAPFVHDILNQVATAGRDYLSSCVGSTEGGGEDFNRLCFVHEPIIGTGSAALGSTLCQSSNWFQKA